MVENKKTKRERDIKAKLMAAIAMLLVSSIMMVSTTYAWFTLSTAPEVTGITTSIASNGNLEIALSPRSGVGSHVGNATTGMTDLTLKNLTWGNLVDMAHESYGLDKLTLAPAELALSGDAAAGYTLNGNVLGTPSYGSDGRISKLVANAYIAGKTATGTGYDQATGEYGVRAVGTASGMSAQQSQFKNSVNAIGTYASAAAAAASNSLTSNGHALAGMLVAHATAEGTDTNNYAKYVPALKQLAADLSKSLANIDEALRSALIAAVCTIQDNPDTADVDEFAAAVAVLEAGNLEELVTTATLPAGFDAVWTARNAVAAKIDAAVEAADALPEVTLNEDGTAPEGVTVLWADAGDVLTNLMNTSGDIKVSGYTIDDLKAKLGADDMYDFAMSLALNCQIELGVGSGVYYDIAALTGNISAKVPNVPLSAKGISVTLPNVFIKTVVTGTAQLPALKTAINGAITPAGASGTAVLDSFYGYVIDLMVRTNAADSHLQLQTDPAQRVYEDSANEATMGKGATIVFTGVESNDAASIYNLARAIRVVFFDPTHGNQVFGLAKVTSVVMSDAYASGEKDDEGEDIMVVDITAALELCQIVAGSADGMFVAGDVKESQVLCALTQNVPQAISAMVYLEGKDVTSADVLADENISGALNLQFSSDADLVPMMNSDLYTGGNGGQTPNP